MKKQDKDVFIVSVFCMNATFIIARKSRRKQVILEDEKRAFSHFNNGDNAY